MPDKKTERATWLRFSGMGFEFAAAVVGLTLVGYWIGGHYGRERGGLLIGATLGILGGGYNLIRESLLATKEAQRRNQENPDDEGQ